MENEYPYIHKNQHDSRFSSNIHSAIAALYSISPVKKHYLD